MDNLEVSYELSIKGKRMDLSGRRLLSVLSLLPAGAGHEDVPALLPDADRAANTLRRAGLAFDEAGRTRVLAPLREYVAANYPPDSEAQKSVIAHYVGIVEQYADKVGGSQGAEAVKRLEPETGNVEAIFPAALESAIAEEAVKAAVGWAEFVRFTGLGSASCVEFAARMSESLGMTRLQANCIKSLGDIALERSNHDEARTQYEKALELFRRIPEPYSIGWAHRRLARVAREEQERQHHILCARQSWENIGRPDLIGGLDEEFGVGR